MKILGFVLAAAALLSAQTVTPPKTNLKIGDQAPDFSLPDTDNKPVTLSDFRGKKTVVLAFFPAAFTGGCTKEMESYRGMISNFQDAGAEVFAISTDFTPTLAHWKKELGASQNFLSDHMRKVSEQYGVLSPQLGIANRTTFVVDTEGKIVSIDEGKSAIDPTGAETSCRRVHKTT